ncbi:unnamed protein product [Moneuplotes crassus]|uniref:Uncharacterized protein n=1 Tax=Euplotes crassus TaxID=5936 RepID=A0AAD2D070_EUPCR|nr:unnamed protein product [Moneuplotes crassus]
MARVSVDEFINIKDFVRMSIGIFNVLANAHNDNFDILTSFLNSQGINDGSLEFEKIMTLDKNTLGVDSFGTISSQGFWKSLKKELFQKVCTDQLSSLGFHSPGKSKKFDEPTISSIRKARAAVANTESSVSSRSVSKEKCGVFKRTRQFGKFINKSKNIYEDDGEKKSKQTLRKKKGFLGTKKHSCSSQRSLAHLEPKNQIINLTVSSNLSLPKKSQGKIVTPTGKTSRVPREMKTPSFGNNSGQDDHPSLYKDSHRREKGLEAVTSAERTMQERHQVSKEIEVATLKRMEKPGQAKISLCDSDKITTNDERILQYASLMGHKKIPHGMKKNSLEDTKTSIGSNGTSRGNIRNHQKLISKEDSKSFSEISKFETNKLPEIQLKEVPPANSQTSERNDMGNKQLMEQYSTEKERYVKYELANQESDKHFVPKPARDSIKDKREDYEHFIDRPLNSIYESNRSKQSNPTSLHSETNMKTQNIIGKEGIHEKASSAGKLQRKIVSKKGSDKKSKITPLITKEYKEDKIQGYDFVRNKIGKSNSFEGRYKSLQPLHDSSKELQSLKALQSNDKNSRYSRNLIQKKELMETTYDKKSMILIQNSELLDPQASKMTSMKTYTNELIRKDDSGSYLKKQPKYFKNMNMPASLPSHQTGAQPWPSKRYNNVHESNASLREDASRASSEMFNSDELVCSSGAAVSYNDHNLLEKEMEKNESSKMKQRNLNNRYSKGSSDGLTHLILTPEDRVRVKRFNSNENYTAVYRENIEENKLEDSSSVKPEYGRESSMRTITAMALPGKVLNKIMGYYGDQYVMNSLCKEIRNKIKTYTGIGVSSSIGLSKENGEHPEEADKEPFKISSTLRSDYDSQWCRDDWGNLILAIQNEELSPKDSIVLNLYFTFMGVDLSFENLQEELLQIMESTRENHHQHFDPDQHFTFNESNIEKIRELLISLNNESFMSSEVSQLGIFDVFTNIIIEALQFLEFIPS